MIQPKATIVGGKGFIGQHLNKKLCREGWTCSIPDKQPSTDSFKNMGHVFYCAGLTADFTQRPFDTVEAHVSSLSKILQFGIFQSLTYLSSTRLYDSCPHSTASEETYLSLNPNNPRHLFDLSKALGESLCLVTGKNRARIARLACVYNNHTDGEGFLPYLLKQTIQKQTNTIYVDSSPSFARDYIHMEDVLDALIMIATKGKNNIYNVASGENVTNEKLFATLSQAGNCQIVALRDDTAPHTCKISIEKIQKEFEWKPTPVLQKISSIIKDDGFVKSPSQTKDG